MQGGTAFQASQEHPRLIRGQGLKAFKADNLEFCELLQRSIGDWIQDCSFDRRSSMGVRYLQDKSLQSMQAPENVS